MTAASSSNAPRLTPEAEPLDAPEPPFAPAPIEELLRLVVKAARAQQLYLPNNPMYRTALDNLRAGFRPIWEQTNELPLVITESEIRWYGAVVARESAANAKSPDNLAWLFYKDGVRELKLSQGFEESEIVTLLEIIKRARKAAPDEDDLVSMLWEADFTLLTYKFVDLLQEGGDGELADGTEVTASSSDDVRRGTQEAVEESRAAGLVNMADFDATLYFLDDREIEYLQAEIAREYAEDLRLNVVSALFDIFEAQIDPEIRSEVLDDLSTMMLFLLTAGHFRGVATVLREAQVALGRANEITPDQRQRLVDLPDRLSAPDVLSQMLQALDESPTLPPTTELVELFDQLRPTALGTVFLWLARIRSLAVKTLLETAAGRLASANTAELVRLIQAPEPEVAAEAIRRAGALKAQAAVLALSKMLGEADVARRQLAVQALTEIGSPGALQALERAVEDADREVRMTAVRALTTRAYRPVLGRIESIVKGRGVRDADLTEKMAMFEAYGALCGDAGVGYLDSLLNGKGFLGRREDPEVRACAAVALGRIGSPKAADALRRASGEKDIVVRNAVNRALRGAGE